MLVALIAYFWLPGTPENAWFLNAEEKLAAKARSLRDGSKTVESEFSLKQAFATWKGWRFYVWCIICFTYPVAFSTTSNFLPQVNLTPALSKTKLTHQNRSSPVSATQP